MRSEFALAPVVTPRPVIGGVGRVGQPAAARDEGARPGRHDRARQATRARGVDGRLADDRQHPQGGFVLDLIGTGRAEAKTTLPSGRNAGPVSPFSDQVSRVASRLPVGSTSHIAET